MSEYQSPLPKSLERYRDKIETFVDYGRDNKVYDEGRYVIGLAPGWKNANDAHAILERTIADAIKEFSYVTPCDCEECKEGA